jgi:hypothetical protein
VILKTPTAIYGANDHDTALLEYVLTSLAWLTGHGRVDVSIDNESHFSKVAVPTHQAVFINGRQVLAKSIAWHPVDEDYPTDPGDGPHDDGPKPTNPPAGAGAIDPYYEAKAA